MIRAVTLDDLPDVSWVTKAAFGGLHAQASSSGAPHLCDGLRYLRLDRLQLVSGG